MKKSWLLFFLVLATTLSAQKIKVTCVGNSVTYGSLLENRETNCYPAQLQQMLGDGYEVGNFGKNGATLLNKGHRPYKEQEEYQAAIRFAGDRVIIHLGLNDTDPRNWPNYRDDFVNDYLALIGSFRKANPACQRWICRMTGLPASTFQHIKQHEYMKIKCTKLPDLPGINGNTPLGVSAPFVGFSNGALLIGGGCNFPDKPVTEGGTKCYYSELFVLDTASATAWKQVGHLPVPVAYGASATTSEGVVCIGGNNSEQSFRTVFLLKWNGTVVETVMLPQLPAEMDNLSATAAGSCIYVAGGNEEQKACNTFFVLDLQQGEKATWTRLPDFPGAARVQPVLVALQTEGKVRIYLTGGFQPLSDNQEAIIPTDMLVYSPDTKTWNKETELPPVALNSPRTLTGGCAVAYGDSSILLMGGVNYNRFLPALNRPLYIRQAEESGQATLADSLREEGKMYLHHPVDWYQFNTSLLQYTPLTGEWKNVGEYEQLARAGAGAVIDGNRLFIANGELKPGIRTPQVNQLSVK